MAITSKLQQQGGFVEAIVDTDPRSGSIENLPINSIVYFSGQSFQKIGTGQNDYTTLNGIKTVTSNYTLQNSDSIICGIGNFTVLIPNNIQKNKIYKIINNGGGGNVINVSSGLTYQKDLSLSVNRNLNTAGSFFEFYITNSSQVFCLNDKHISPFISCVAGIGFVYDHNIPGDYVSVNYITDSNEVGWTTGFKTDYITQDFQGKTNIQMSNGGNYKFIFEDIAN